MTGHRHATDRTDWTYIAECPNNGDCEPIRDELQLDEDPEDCEHLTLEAEATNAAHGPEELVPLQQCPVCGEKRHFIKQEEPREVLD